MIGRIKAAWRAFREPEARSLPWEDPSWGPTVSYGGIDWPTGDGVSVEAALTLSAAFACINVLATDSAVLPLQVFRRTANEGREAVPDHPINALFSETPDGETTPMRWRQAYHGHVLGWGNAYAEIIRNGRGTEGEPVQLHLLDPRTRPDRKGGRLIYRDPDGVEYRPRNVLHLAGLGYDGLCGYSPVALARHGIRLGLNAQQSGISLFANGALPKGVLQVPQQLKPDAYKRLRESWELIHRGVENAHKIAILEQGATWQQTSIDPEDAQFLASRQFSVVEVSRFYRIPPNLIGDLTQSHLNNFEASQIDYVTKTLAPWLVNLEQEIGLKLLTKEERKAGLYVKHNMAALLRGDMRARAEFYTKMRDLGAFSPNMILAKEDMNPIEGGDIHLVPVNMQELSRAALPPEPAPAPPGKPPAPDGPNETQDDDEAENEGPASRTAPLNGARFHL